MEDKICLDTDFLVNFLRNKEAEVLFIQKHESKVILATTHINLFELYYGAYKSKRIKNIKQVEELQHRIHILSTSKEAVKHAGQILTELEEKGAVIDFRDLLIGCIAVSEGFCVKTNNKKHFERIPDITLY